MPLPPGFEAHRLDEEHSLFAGLLPGELHWDETAFEAAWQLRPEKRHRVVMIGKPVELPRDQQAYGATYKYTGSENRARPIPRVLKPLLDWSQQEVEARLNGVLLNWYDGPGDYIGPHHDSTRGLFADTPIVTISFGEERIFRLTKWSRKRKTAQHDFPAIEGRVFIMPWTTNKAWKHEIARRTTYKGRRISVTIRAFAEGVLPSDLYEEPF